MDRIRIFEILVFGIAFIILVRLFYWQFINPIAGAGDGLSNEDFIPAPRGDILANDGFPLVTNQQAYLLYAKPKVIKDPQKVAEVIAPFLISEKYATSEAKLSEDEEKKKEEEIRSNSENLQKKLSNIDLFWVQLARRVSSVSEEKLRALEIEGLGFESDQKRFYPEGSMAAQLLGFVASNKQGEDTGYFGLEGFWDGQLKGKSGRLGEERDPMGFPILVGSYRYLLPKKGATLHLSIDRAVQYIVEEKLKLAVEKYGAKEGTIIVANPKDGSILAMATYPNYHPAFYNEFDEKLFKNPAIADTYEPGSTFKLISMAAALDSSVVKPETICDACGGPRKIGGYEISTWNKKYYPNSTMKDVIVHSDNVGMTFVGEKIGIDRFYDYIKRFGFGEKTGIDLQEEAEGGVRNEKDWKEIDLATASFGQGIAVTPIQMIQAVGVIANNGKIISPGIAQKIVDGEKEESLSSKVEKQVISVQTAAQITEMMVAAVEEGEARVFAPKGIRIAGKTGTAQIPVSGHYDPNKTIASFVGFAPTDDPRFVMLVRFTEPTSSPFGSETAAPTFFAIAKELFNFYGIVSAQ